MVVGSHRRRSRDYTPVGAQEVRQGTQMINLAHFDEPAQAVLAEARRQALHRHRRAIGSCDIMAGLIDRVEIVDLLTRMGFPLSSLVEHLGEAPPPPNQLLGDLGIDLDAVRSVLPAKQGPVFAPWRLRRSLTRPLRITIDGPSSSMAFDGSGRKVLEVAVWASRRNGRTAGPLDLLRGVVSDGADPVVGALTTNGPGPFKQLLLEFARLDAQPV